MLRHVSLFAFTIACAACADLTAPAYHEGALTTRAQPKAEVTPPRTQPQPTPAQPAAVAPAPDANKEPRIRASHILIGYKGSAHSKAERDKAAAKALAEKIVAEARKSPDFAELAKKYSEGPTGPRGGDLGFFEAGRMVKPFSDAAFALQVGQVSDAVETQFGFHVIKRTE